MRKKKKSSIRFRMFSKTRTKGDIIFPILIGVVIVGAVLISGATFFKTALSTPPPTDQTLAATCCDSGDGDACHPLTGSDQTFTFEGQAYGLLKSGITLTEAIYHLKDSGQKFDGNPIILNSTDGYSHNIQECGQGKNDQIWAANGCFPIPNDEIVYVCKKNCVPAAPNTPFCGTMGVSCYGNSKTEYDAYFKLSEYPNPGIPDPIKNCVKKAAQGNEIGQQEFIFPDNSVHKNLQLKTFEIKENTGAIPWLSPYCKPAIYLYPTQKTQVSVRIQPKGNLTLTIPQYPPSGWNVTAYPNGNILSNNQLYKYLYYEAQIPNNLIDQEKDGYVVAYSDLPSFFTTLLPRLGLNTSEQQDFSAYWIKALPKSSYYKINVVPVSLLNTISPLSITPTPNSLIRVTLYFTPLDKKISIPQPILPKVQRTGFTVVEWGGLFKKSPDHPFTCMM